MVVDKQVTRDEELLDKLSHARARIMNEVRKAILGQDEVIEQVLMSIFVGGHTIITGVPGLAKTLLIRTLANVLDLSFKRIQFTPDLMPADITGTEIIEEDRLQRITRHTEPLFKNRSIYTPEIILHRHLVIHRWIQRDVGRCSDHSRVEGSSKKHDRCSYPMVCSNARIVNDPSSEFTKGHAGDIVRFSH